MDALLQLADCGQQKDPEAAALGSRTLSVAACTKEP